MLLDSLQTYAGAAYEARTDTAARARSLATDFLRRAAVTGAVRITAETLGAVQLVVSELVTNVIKYTVGPCVFELELAEDALEISVWDTDPAHLPMPASPDALRPAQHGLEVVHALCRNVTSERRAGGKRVRASLALA
ncbi:ATP-binding protein [Streptomyces sp. NPDC086554]|uniref:ATP-binding protein n=1 Tax=Streptomyces sp. NPDC086554 TaxID=3154864 RepID=UPI00342A6566